MQITLTAQLAELLSQPEQIAILRKLANLPPHYFSKSELAWKLGGESRAARNAVYVCIDNLVRADCLDAIVVTHNGKPLRIVKIDPDVLSELLVGSDR